MKICCIYFADTCFDKYFAYMQGILLKLILNTKTRKRRLAVTQTPVKDHQLTLM